MRQIAIAGAVLAMILSSVAAREPTRLPYPETATVDVVDDYYPATLITTADHDDRVVPAHSF